MERYNLKGNKMKDYIFCVTVCCQGNPTCYYRESLISALWLYVKKYLKFNKYGTMNFTLKQVFKGTSEYPI